MRRIRFHINADKPMAVEVLSRLKARACELGMSTTDGDDAEAVIVLGGDGTLLRAVHRFRGIPVLGFNLGGLGYLSAVEERDFEQALGNLASGHYTISERKMLEAGGYVALNDIVVTRELSGHSARLDLRADGKLVTSYMADGLIFSTPTGSTAYSLAAGGPVLMPDTECIVVTPMNPHALGVRPLVTRDGVKFSVTACARTAGNAMKIGVYADGENVLTLGEGETVEIAKSERVAKLVKLEGYDAYGVLARKLGWSGSNVK